MDAVKTVRILNRRGEEIGEFPGGDIREAMVNAASKGANLKGAYLKGAYLEWAYLEGANLEGANLEGANLKGAYLCETFEAYLSEVVPALLTAGGKTLAEVLASGAWDCHSWDNCPMRVALGITSPDQAPPLLRPRVRQFVQLFDAGLIPLPAIQEGA